ncbi:MAG: iron-sulfur cluster assembly protein [archaeon]|nr:iron-sulfur cluster assembly protein [archaeon]
MTTETEVREALKKVVDPELNLNIVDLGLIYEVHLEEEGKVKIVMSLTSPGCPYGPQLLGEAKSTVAKIEGVKEAAIQLSFNPPWTPKMASEEIQAMFEQYL